MSNPESGKFYWVKTAFDPDSDESWVNELQPALFSHGEWVLLGTEAATLWPVIFVGEEIKP